LQQALEQQKQQQEAARKSSPHTKVLNHLVVTVGLQDPASTDDMNTPITKNRTKHMLPVAISKIMDWKLRAVPAA
jgi:hypothetical protein